MAAPDFEIGFVVFRTSYGLGVFTRRSLLNSAPTGAATSALLSIIGPVVSKWPA
jgi:hypothetical protein